MILYKYLPPERIDVLRDAVIRFTQPAAFNDPFECRPVPIELADLDWKPPDDEHPECVEGHVRSLEHALTNHERRSVGLLCLSEKPDDTLMWAHYASDHTGFVIGFDVSDRFFAKSAANSGLWPVRYADVRPRRPVGLLEAALRSHPGPHALGLMSVFSFGEYPFTPDTHDPDYRFVKNREWAYEREWRLLKSLSGATHVIEQGKRLPAHLFRFPRQAVKTVIVGCRGFSRLYPQIAEILSAHPEHLDTELYRAELNTSRFQLETVRFKPPMDVRLEEDLRNLDMGAQHDWMVAQGIWKNPEEVDGLIDPDDA